MRKIKGRGILAIIAGILMSLPFIMGCEDTDCTSFATNNVIVRFYDLESLDSISVSFDIVTALDTDSIIYDQNDTLATYNLPANPAMDSSVFLFRNNDATIDTLIVRYLRTVRLLSEDCGFEQNYSQLDASTSFPGIEVISGKLDKLNEQDIKIYL